MKFSSIQGYTLVELVISMTIISVALLGVFLAINTASRYSADPMIVQQGIAIVESYLEEIMGKDFPVSPCPVTTRANFNNVCNYHGLFEPPTDQTGNVVPGLGNYNVSVIVDTRSVTLGSPALTPQIQVVRVDVSITHPAMQELKFSLYRTSY